MLSGIDPLLTGGLLADLDEMGHSDALVVADANFPAYRLADRLVELPGLTAPDVLRAIGTVVPLDDAPAVDLMESADGSVLPVQRELIEAAGAGRRGPVPGPARLLRRGLDRLPDRPHRRDPHLRERDPAQGCRDAI